MLNQQLNKFVMCWILIWPFQIFLVMILGIQPNIRSDINNSVQQSLTYIYNKLLDVTVIKICSYLGCILTIIFLCILIIFLIIKKKNNYFQKYQQLLNKLIIITAFVVYLYEVVLIGVLWDIRLIFQNTLSIKKNSQETFMLLFCILGSIIIGIINYKIRVYGIFLLPSIFLLNMRDDLDMITSLLNIIIGLYLLQSDKNNTSLIFYGHNIRKIIHLVLIGFYFWKIMQNILAELQNQHQNLYLSYLYLCLIMMILMILGYFKFTYKINKNSFLVVQLCQCLQNIQKDQNDIQSKLLSLQIVNQYFRLIQKISQNNEKLQKLKLKRYKNWCSNDWNYLVHMMIKQQYQKQPSIILGVNMLKCRLMIKDLKIYQITQLLKDIIQIDKQENIRNKYQILKIIFQTKSIFFKQQSRNQLPIFYLTKRVDQLNQIFYNQCCQTVSLIYQFWANVITYKISIDGEFQTIHLSNFIQINQNSILEYQSLSKMENNIVDIYQKINVLTYLLKQISHITVAKKQAQTLSCIKFLVTYCNETHDYSHHQTQQKHVDGFSVNVHSQKDFSQFFQAVNLNITQISLKLANQLGYRKLQVVGQNLSFLMPKQYMTQIQNAIINHNQPCLKIPYLVPLICSDNSLILKNLTSHVQLDCVYGYRIIYHMKSNIINKDPILIYNASCNIIEYYNKAFITTFKINKQKIDIKIKNNQFNPDSIFKDMQLSNKSIQAKLSQSGLQSQYNCKMEIQQIGSKQLGNIIQDVRLSLIQKQKQFMILKIMKGYKNKIIKHQTFHQKKTTKTSLSTFALLKYDTSRLSQRQKKYRNIKHEQNEIFCKIQNPYQSKINTKKLQLSKTQKINGKLLRVLLVSILVLFLLIDGLVFLSVHQQINSKVKQQQENNINLVCLYTKLMMAYQGHYKYALFMENQQTVEKLGIDFNQTLNAIGLSISQSITSFQSGYLSSLANKTQKNYPYDIQFKYFNIQTTSNTSNLFDFSQNILYYGNQNSLNFLITNYYNFIFLAQNVFNSFSTMPDKLTINTKTQDYVGKGILYTAILFTAFSFFINIKMAIIRRDIKVIFQLMQKKSIQLIFQSLITIKNQFLQLKQLKNQVKYKYAIDAYFKKKEIYDQDTLQNFDNMSIATTLEQAKLKIEGDIKRQLNVVQQVQQKRSNNQSLDKIKVKKQIKCWALVGYFSVIASLFSVKTLQFNFFHWRIGMEYQIIQFQLQNWLITDHLINQILLAEHLLLSPSQRNKSTEHLGKIWLANNQKLPKGYFDQYTQQHFKKVSKNLCKVINLTLVSFTQQQCLKVGNGLFFHGVSVVIQNAFQLLQSLQNSNASYFFSIAPDHEFPIYRQISMIQQMVIQINRLKNSQLIKYIDQFHNQMNILALLIFIFCCFICLILLTVVLKIKYQIFRTSKISVGYFLILPKKVLLEDLVLNHLRKKQILSRIDFI